MDAHRNAVREQFSLQAAPFTEAVHANDPVLLRLLLDSIAPKPDDLVVDFCAGPGIVGAALLPLVRRVVLLDLTGSMLLEAARLAPSALRIEGDATRAPLRAGAADVAVSRLAFHHVREPDEMLEEMKRVTDSNGRIVVCDIITSEDEMESRETEHIEQLRDPSHARCLSPSAFRALFARNGLAIEEERSWEMVVDHDEWMNRVYPPEENRPLVLALLEKLEGADRGGMKVWRENGRLMILRRGVIIRARREQ